MFQYSYIHDRFIKSLLTSCKVLGLIYLATISVPAFAGGKMQIDDTRWLSVGMGMRTSFTSVEDAAPSGSARGNNFNVESVRLYFNGQVHENIKFTLNTEETFAAGSMEILDSFVQFEMSPMVNVWFGLMLTPADRIEMNGPYYALTWNQYTQPLYPSDQGGAAGRYGRDDGVVLWGKAGKLQYAVGMFDGLQGGANVDDDMLYAGRFAYNALNMEDKPGYYTSSTYYGGLGNIFTVAFSFQSQAGGSGTAATSGDFSGFALDVFSETVMGGNVLTVEGEFKSFEADYTAKPPVAGACFCLFDGDSFYVSVAYLLPKSSAMGRWQPYFRFVTNSPSDDAESDLIELGANYVISGHNARLNVNYASGDAGISGYPAPGGDADSISVGIQIQL